MQLHELPSTWIWTTISELGSVVSGGTPSTKEADYWGGDVAWISPSDLTGYTNKYIGHGAKSLTVAGLKNSSAKVMPAGSVHFSSRAPIGYTAISSQDMTTNQGFKSLVPSKGVFNEYVYYYFKASKQLAESVATGTTFKEISGSAFAKLPVPLPPEREQHRIVAKIEELFSELDKGIESLKTAKTQLKVYRQALLKHAFEGKLTAQWRAENPDKLETAEALLERIQRERTDRHRKQLADWETQGKKGTPPKLPAAIRPVAREELETLPRLPSSWCYVRAEEICGFITKGTTPSKDLLFAGSGDVPFIKVYNLTKTGALDFSIDPTFVSCETHNSFLARSKVYPNDVLMNIVGPPLGKVSIVPCTYPEWNINQAIAIFRSSAVSPRFLAEYLASEPTVRSMTRKSKATAGQFNLTLEICREVSIPLCCKAEQEEIECLIDKSISEIDRLDLELASSLNKAEVLRQSILEKAFSGQLVPQDPTDESASALLARIKAAQSAPPKNKKARK